MSDPYAAIASPAKADPYAQIASPAKTPAKPAYRGGWQPKSKAYQAGPQGPVAQWVDQHVAQDGGVIGKAFRAMRSSADSAAAEHDRRDATPAPAFGSFGQYWGDELKAAARGGVEMLQNARESMTGMGEGPHRPPGNAMAPLRDAVTGIGLIAASPLTAATHGVVVRPAATAASKVPGLNYRDSEDAINMALMGMGPEGRIAGGAGAVRAASRAVRPAAIARPNGLQQSIARFDAAEVPPSLAAAKPGMAPLAKVPASNAFAGGRTRGFIRGQIDAVQAKAGKVANQYGNATTRQGAGQTIQKGVENFANGKDGVTFKTRSGELYDNVFDGLDKAMAGKQSPRTVTPVQQPIGPGAFSVGPDGAVTPATVRSGSTVTGGSKVSTSNAQVALHEMTDGAAQAKPIADLISSPTIVKVAKAVRDGTGDMSFGDLRRLRTWVREAQKDPELRQNISSADLQHLEGALTQDIYANAKGLGSPKLLHQLQRADDYYAAGMQRLNGKLEGVFKAKSDESVFDLIHKAAKDGAGADLARLTAAKRSLGADWGDVAATMVKRLGKPTAGAVRGAEGGEEPFSLSRFVTNYSDLSPAGRETMFGARGGGGAKAGQLKAALDNLASVAGDLKAVESAANHSNTATHAQTLATIGLITHPPTTIPTVMGLAGEAVTGEIMTNPAVVRWIARAVQAKTPAQTASTGAQLQQLIKANPQIAGQLKTLGTALNRTAPAAGYTSRASTPASSTPGSQ